MISKTKSINSSWILVYLVISETLCKWMITLHNSIEYSQH